MEILEAVVPQAAVVLAEVFNKSALIRRKHMISLLQLLKDALLILGPTLILIILNGFILPHVHLTTGDGERKWIDMLGVITFCLYITFVMLYILATPKTVMRLIKELGLCTR